jgi:hypothetical protein
MYKPSRRDFLRTSAIAGSAALVCWFSPRAFVETALAGTPSAEADSFIPRPVKPGDFFLFHADRNCLSRCGRRPPYPVRHAGAGCTRGRGGAVH